MRLTTQNLTPHGYGPMWRHGRAHLVFDDGHGTATAGVEWVLPGHSCALAVEVADDAEHAVKLHTALPPVNLHLWVEFRPLGRWLHAHRERLGYDKERDWGEFRRELAVRVHGWALWWRIWRNPHCGHSRDLRDGAWYPFGTPGARVGPKKIVETCVVDVPLPEKTYRARATRSLITTRGTPSWPFSRPVLSYVELEFSPPYEPVPIPGKGTESYNLGEDATYSTSGAHRSIEESVGAFVGRTLEHRRRYGGRTWRPAPKTPAATTPTPAANGAKE